MKQKTLQEQYNLIKEGKGNAETFMKAAKKQFPNFVRNAATLNETISSLKHNHIISENMFGIGMVTTGKSNPDWFKIFNENMEVVAEEAKAVEKKVSKEVEELEEKNFDYKDPKNVDNVFGEEFLKGYYTEMKDPKNADKSVDELKEIVAKNLAKDRLHYVKDGQFGEKGVGYTDELPGLKASKTDKMEKVPMNEGRINLLDIVEGYSEFQRDDKGSKGVTAKDKGEQDAYGAGVKAGEKIEKKKMKKESTDSKLAEIEKNGKIATLEMQIEALEEIIESKNQRISMVTEDESLAELVDKKKMKDMQREVKDLEKKKMKMEKLYEKMSGKKYAKKEVVDEVNINPEADEISDEDLEAASDYFDNVVDEVNINPEADEILAELVDKKKMKVTNKKQLTKIKNNLEDENYLPAMDDETRKTLLTMINKFLMKD